MKPVSIIKVVSFRFLSTLSVVLSLILSVHAMPAQPLTSVQAALVKSSQDISVSSPGKMSGNASFTVSAAPTSGVQTLSGNPDARLGNISTRSRVQTGDSVMIGGFVIEGTTPKKVIVVASGQSLTNHGVSDALHDTTLELHDGSGAIIASNDDWEDSQRTEIEHSTVVPEDARESALVLTLSPGAYTAIVRGKSNTSGVALVAVYDLDNPGDTKLKNISTRSSVETGDNVMIGGVIITGSVAKKVVIRATGPSLANYGVSGALSDTILELHDVSGAIIASNDNWQDSQGAELQSLGYSLSDTRESGLVVTLNPGNYTAIVQGKNGTTGVSLLEMYDLGPGK